MAEAGMIRLVPGAPAPPAFSLVRYRTPHPDGAVRAALETATEPGDLVLEVAGSGSGVMREALALHRRILAVNLNPIPLLWAALALNPAPLHDVQKALTQLGDLPKAGAPLINHVNRLYATRCPRCRRQATALWFVWDRDTQRPVAKRVRCPACEATYDGPVDEQDLQTSVTYPPGDTPAFHVAISRAAGGHEQLRPYAADLIQRYTSRNLSVLMDILYRLPQLTLTGATRRVMVALVLEAFDQGSSLWPYHADHVPQTPRDAGESQTAGDASPPPRPHSLRAPARFLEYNVWHILEQRLDAYRRSLAADGPPPAHPPADSIPDLLAQPHQISPPTRDYLLLNHSVQSLEQSTLRGAVQAIVIHAAPPDATFWALSALWSAWLWGDEIPAAHRNFMRRRRLEDAWYQQGLSAALRHLKPLLRPGGVVLMLMPDDDASLVRGAVQAFNETGSVAGTWFACPPQGYRITMRWPAPGAAPAPPAPEATGAAATLAAGLVRQILVERGEPTLDTVVTAAAVLASRRPNLPLPDPETAVGYRRLSDDRLWLTDRESPAAHPPLADRVEQALRDLLEPDVSYAPAALTAELYAQFSGPLSPEPALVAACIAAYTRQDEDGQVRLRPEDEPRRRRAESQTIRAQVRELGERLGYNVAHRLNGDVVWREGRERRYRFRVLTTAQLGSYLLKSRPPGAERPCFLIPGGRSALVALKLERDPRLQAIVEDQRWTFIKFRHLRRMVDEVQSRDDIEVYLGLDPIVERQRAQIPLPLDLRTESRSGSPR